MPPAHGTVTAGLVRLTLGPALHHDGPGTGHQLRPGLYAKLERPATVGVVSRAGDLLGRRRTRWPAPTPPSLRATGSKIGGSPVSGGKVNAGPSAAKVTWQTKSSVPFVRGLPTSARQVSVSSVQAAAAAAANAAAAA
jgi:hypothetical protein